MDILKNNEELMEVTNDVTGIKYGIESLQATIEEKIAKFQEKVYNK